MVLTNVSIYVLIAASHELKHKTAMPTAEKVIVGIPT